MSCSCALRRSPKPGRLDGDRLEDAADLVHDQGGEGLPVDVLGDDQQLLAGLDHLVDDREQVLDVRDLRVDDQDVRVFEDGFLTLGVGHEVLRQVALVEPHALGELQLGAEGVRLLDRDDAFLAHLVDGLGDERADLGVTGGDRCRGGDLFLGLDLLGLGDERLGDRGDGLLDAALEADRVGAGRDVAQAFVHERLGEHGSGGGAVAGYVIRLLGDLLNELGADLLERVVEFDLLGDRDAVVGDRGGAPLLFENDVATARAKRHLYRVGQNVKAALETASGLFVERNNLCHVCFSSLPDVVIPATPLALAMREC